MGGSEPERGGRPITGNEDCRSSRFSRVEPMLSREVGLSGLGAALPPSCSGASFAALRPIGGRMGGKPRSRDTMRLPGLELSLVLAEDADLITEDPAAANLPALSFSEEGSPEPRRTKAWPLGLCQLVPAPEAPLLGSAFAFPVYKSACSAGSGGGSLLLRVLLLPPSSFARTSGGSALDGILGRGLT